MTLQDLPMNTIGVVEDLQCDSSIQRRLLDLGLVKGTKIKPIFQSPFGDPTAFEIRKTLIALRKKDTKLILITEEIPL